jgi:cytochrome oxidase Cu insertion factor (SCO1/SenC/PrrC family)
MLAGGAAMLLIWRTVMSTQRPARSPARIGGPFQLIDSQGRAVTEHSWPGKYLLVYLASAHDLSNMAR